MDKLAFRMRISNTSEKAMRFRLEPWADEKELLMNESLVLNLTGPIEDTLELEVGDNELVLYGWTGSVCEIEEGV
jgi:hypothetical protein